MKKIILYCLLIISSAAHAQGVKKNAVKAGAFIGSFNISYERVLSNRSAVAISPAIGIFTSDGLRYSIAGAGAEYRYYLSLLKMVAPKGFYLATGAGYYAGNISITDSYGSETKSNINGTAVKITGGYQHLFGRGFLLDISGGSQYLLLKFKGGGGLVIEDEAFDGFVPYIGVNFGYAF